MILVRFLARLAIRLGLRWVVAGAVARLVARRFTRSTISAATEELDQRAQNLPAPVARAVSALPPEARQMGGTALAAGRAARTAASTSRRAGTMARRASRWGWGAAATVRGTAGSVRGGVDRVRHESEASRRRLRAQYLSATLGPEAGTDALLDIRTEPDPPPMSVDDDGLDPSLHDEVPGPVRPGRRRRVAVPATPVNRRRRSYRPQPRPWDR